MPGPSDGKFEGPGAEALNPRDRALNKLSKDFQQQVHFLSIVQYTMLTPADSDKPESHARVDIENVKVARDILERLSNLTDEIEKANAL